MRLSTLGVAAVLPVLSASLPAQGSLHMLLGFAGDNKNQAKSVPIAGLYDLDHDGKIDASSTELFAYLRKVFSVNGGRGGFIFDEQHVVERGDVSFYIADAGDGYVLLARDKNANGVIDDPEIKPFVQFGTAGTFGPNSIALHRVGSTTVLYTALNSDRRRQAGRVTGIYRTVDKNNNGVGSDTGETAKLLDQSDKLTFPGKSGMVTLANDNWERIRVVPRSGTIVAYNAGRAGVTLGTDQFCYFGFKETNGKLTSRGVFFNPSQLNGLPVNADLASGALEDLDITFQRNNQTQFFNGFPFCEIDANGFRLQPVVYFANAYSATRSFGSKNKAGKSLHGVVLRGFDANNDGDLQDKGEVTVFFNGSGNDLKGGAAGVVKSPSWVDPINGKVNQITGFVTGLAEGEGLVYLLLENGAADEVLELNDKNRNRVIETGEVRVIYVTPQPFPKVFSKQFGPFSLELHAIDRSLVVDPMPVGAVPFGAGCVGSNGLDSRVSISGGGPTIGNTKLRVEIKRAQPGLASFLFMGLSNKLFNGTIPLPIPLAGLGMGSCAQRVSAEFVFPTVNSTAGSAWLPLPLPRNTALQGVKLYFQWWTQDVRANAAQLITTNGVELTIR